MEKAVLKKILKLCVCFLIKIIAVLEWTPESPRFQLGKCLVGLCQHLPLAHPPQYMLTQPWYKPDKEASSTDTKPQLQGEGKREQPGKEATVLIWRAALFSVQPMKPWASFEPSWGPKKSPHSIIHRESHNYSVRNWKFSFWSENQGRSYICC